MSLSSPTNNAFAITLEIDRPMGRPPSLLSAELQPSSSSLAATMVDQMPKAAANAAVNSASNICSAFLCHILNFRFRILDFGLKKNLKSKIQN